MPLGAVQDGGEGVTDMENVISYVISAFDDWENNRCCPGDDWSDVHQSRDMVIALLKAQEPRVLALDEIHRGMAVWLEDVDKADVILAIGGASAGGAKCFITENDTSIAPLSAEYGIRWRAWTAEPTEDQREATPWN